MAAWRYGSEKLINGELGLGSLMVAEREDFRKSEIKVVEVVKKDDDDMNEIAVIWQGALKEFNILQMEGPS